MGNGIFITGTDTDVGKTVVTAGLLSLLRFKGYNFGVMKPFQSGATSKEGKLYAPDLDFILSKVELDDDYDVMNPVRLSHPLAPSLAAKLEGVDFDIKQVLSAYHTLDSKYDGVLVEGAGGLMVPLAEELLVPDLVKALELPIIVVARPNLGTINHTVLTVKMARNLGLNVLGVIINGFNEEEAGIAERTNPKIISELAEVDILGIIPYIEDLSKFELAEVFSSNLNIEKLLNVSS